MIVLKYIITFVLGIISASFIVIILTVLRCGIPFCKAIIKEPDVLEDKKQSSKKLTRKYYLSLLIDFIIVTILSLLVYFPMKETFIFYLILIGFYTLISFSKTGMTTENLLEVNNSLSCNIDLNNSIDNINDLSKYTQLLDLLSKNLGVNTLDDIIITTYTFYNDNGYNIPSNLIDIENLSIDEKRLNLLQILEIALNTKGIDNILSQLEKFYSEINNEVNDESAKL